MSSLPGLGWIRGPDPGLTPRAILRDPFPDPFGVFDLGLTRPIGHQFDRNDWTRHEWDRFNRGQIGSIRRGFWVVDFWVALTG